MNDCVNREVINDNAKRVIHRLIARALARDPSLVDKARASLEEMAARYPNHDFVRDWEQLLRLPVGRIRVLLTSREEEMARLRLLSPFVLADGIDFKDELLRRRIWKIAGRLTKQPPADQDTDQPVRARA
jgi:hypothetical protein